MKLNGMKILKYIVLIISLSMFFFQLQAFFAKLIYPPVIGKIIKLHFPYTVFNKLTYLCIDPNYRKTFNLYSFYLFTYHRRINKFGKESL